VERFLWGVFRPAVWPFPREVQIAYLDSSFGIGRWPYMGGKVVAGARMINLAPCDVNRVPGPLSRTGLREEPPASVD
jgi:hypothetical protein